MITDFNIATDLKVELWAPDEAGNLFIIGVSVLGGRDVLAGAGQFIIGESLLGGSDTLVGESAFGWQTVECSTSNAQIQIGGSIQSSLYFQPEPGSARLTLQSWTWDPNNSSAVRPNTPVRVRLDNGVVSQVLFNGFIDTIDVEYAPGEPNLIQINAFDGYKQLVNTPIPVFDTTGLPAGYATPNDVIEIAAANAGLTVSASSDLLDGKLPLVSDTNVSSATVINDAIQVGLGVLWIDPETGELVVKKRPSAGTTPPLGTWTIGNNHGDAYHLCMSGITSNADIDNIFNSITATLSWDDTVSVSLIDNDSVELYGHSYQATTVNTTDATELTRWTNAVFAQKPTKLIRNVSTPAIDRVGDLTAAAGFLPGTLVGVNYDTPNIVVDDFYTATKVSHSIDVNNWYTTLELWKEF